MKTALHTLVAALLVAACLMAVRLYVATTYEIPAGGLHPILLAGDRIVAFKQQTGSIAPGSIAVFHNPANTQAADIDQRQIFIGYCAATPGNSIGIDTLFNLMPDSKTRLTVPRKGQYVEVTPLNQKLLRNTLVVHEQRNATIEDGELLVDGKAVRFCQFDKDYYWISNSGLIDSRTFGLVPADHLIGKVSMIAYSKAPTQSLLDGWRWERTLKRIATP